MILQFEIPRPATPEEFEYLKNYITKYLNRDTSINPLTPTAIINIVYDEMKCDISLIGSKSRDSEAIVRPRQAAMYFLGRLTKLTGTQIGERCGGKDHATVIHSRRVIKNLMFSDKEFKATIEAIKRKLSA